jgi:predicted RNA methylase
LAPFVPTPENVVVAMLEAARVKPGEVVYDLGCGDGRVLVIAAQRFGARAVGVEISPKQVEAANENIRKHSLQEKCRVIQGDLMETDLREADIVTLYLLTSSNELIRPLLEKQLKPGARVVSHDFEMRGWKPARVEKVDAYKRGHSIYVYEMPARK